MDAGGSGVYGGAVQPQPLLERGFPELFKRLKPVVWFLRVKYSIHPIIYETMLTGFCIKSDGLLLTCTHGWGDRKVLEFKARRNDEAGFCHDVEVCYLKEEWDMALVRVRGLKDCESGVLATVGALNEGETVLHIGYPHYLGSFLTGFVAYRCVNEVSFPTSKNTCARYKSNGWSTTPPYRVMGHVWNFDVFKDDKTGMMNFEKNLDPLLPIIQCNRLTCGEGSSGGPVFNTHGEIVGMVLMGYQGYQIAVHVAAIRELLQRLEKGGGEKVECEHVSKKMKN